MWVNLVLLHSYIITAHAFNKPDLVRDMSLDVMAHTGCGCMVILSPITPTPQEDRFLTQLAFSIAKQETRQVMSYTWDQYLYYYTNDLRLHAGSCLKTLNIAIVGKSTEEQLRQLSKSHLFNKAIWLLFLIPSQKITFVGNADLGLNSGVWVVISIQNRTESELFEIYHVGAGYPMRYGRLGKWMGRGQLEMTRTPKPLRRRDLERKAIRAGVLDRNKSKDKTELSGYFASIWEQLEELLNFRTKISSSVDGSAGLWINNTWTGLIGMMLRKEIDVIITELDFSTSRLEAVEHLLPLQKTKNQVYFKLEGYLADWYGVLKPFSSTIWYSLLIWIFLASVSLYATIILATRTGMRGSKEPQDMTLVNCVFFVIQTVSVQGCSWTPRVWATRLILFLCYLLAAVMLPAYSASLISSLTTKTPMKPFDSLKEMLTTDYRLIVRKKSNRYEYFLNSSDDVLIQVHNQLVWMVPDTKNNVTIDDFKSGVSYTCNNKKIALFAVESELETQYPYGNTPCRLEKLSNPLGDVHQSMGFPKMSPYRDTFNYFILRMAETGVLDRLEHKYQPRWRRPSETPEIPVTIIDVAEIFAFLAISTLVSIILFIMEKITYIRHHHFLN